MGKSKRLKKFNKAWLERGEELKDVIEDRFNSLDDQLVSIAVEIDTIRNQLYYSKIPLGEGLSADPASPGKEDMQVSIEQSLATEVLVLTSKLKQFESKYMEDITNFDYRFNQVCEERDALKKQLFTQDLLDKLPRD